MHSGLVRPSGTDLAPDPQYYDYDNGKCLKFLAPRPGLEPGTCGLTVRRSTN